MEIQEAIDALQRILHEERQRPTSQYREKLTYQIKNKGEERFASLTAAVTNFTYRLNLIEERKKRPRRVKEETDILMFGGINYDLLLRLFAEVREKDREAFVDAILAFVRNGGQVTKVASGSHFPTFNMVISDTPLIAEFCVRTGHLKQLLGSLAAVKQPTIGIVLLLMQLEEMLSLNFDLFTREQLKQIQKELRPVREMAELQTWQKRGPATGKQVVNPHYKRGLEREGREIVDIIDGIVNECNQAIFFYVKGALQKTRNPEVEGDKGQVVAFLNTLGFDPRLKEALEEAEKQYRDDATVFELKTCFVHLRSFLETLHRDSALAIANAAGEAGGKKWGEWVAYLAKKGIFSRQHEIFVVSLYTLMSDTSVHPLIAEREYARLLRNVVIEYGVMFLSVLDKRGIRISPGAAQTGAGTQR